jgi:hypothetical protein
MMRTVLMIVKAATEWLYVSHITLKVYGRRLPAALFSKAATLHVATATHHSSFSYF